LRSAVFVLLVSLQRSVASKVGRICLVFRIRQFAVVWVCLARKGRLCLLWFVIGGCGTWICPVGGRFIRCFIPQKCLHVTFFTIWFCAPTRVRWIVFDVLVVALVVILVRVGSKTTCVVGIKCIIFIATFMWLIGSGWCPPSLFVLYFILCLIYLV
jgi:hypothetical protein